MKLGIFVFGLVFLFWAVVAAGATAKFVFTTDPQTIEPNELSGAITIQSQNESGEKINTTETIDLEFSSTSLTGEFLNSSGNPVSAVMAKNTANRTFYYRDSSPGTYTLNVGATGRESGQSWQVSQQIIVSGAGSEHPTLEESQPESIAEPQSQPASSSAGSEFRAKIIGGDKVAIVGAQVNFEGALFGIEGRPIETADFLWAFGDASYARGRLSNHVYNYPGKYIVYLNAAISGISVSDSIIVNVIPNEVKISEVKPGKNGWVEIFNESDFQTELAHWAISNGKEAFYFPKNTFIDAKTYLVIPNKVSGIEFFNSGSAFLLYPKGDVAHEFFYSGALKIDEGWHSVAGEARVGVESPGSGKFVARIRIPGSQTAQSGLSPAPAVAVQGPVIDNEEFSESQLAAAAAAEEPAEGNFWDSAWAWFGAALGLGLLSAIGYLFIKRKGFL